VKSVITFISGLIAMIAGVFLRSCTPRIPDELLTSWCGGTPPSMFASYSHAHCPGCALLLLGGGLAVIGALLSIRPNKRQPKRVRS